MNEWLMVYMNENLPEIWEGLWVVVGQLLQQHDKAKASDGHS